MAARAKRQRQQQRQGIALAGRTPDVVLIGAVLLATVLAYSPVFDAGFVSIDDPQYFSNNPHILAGLTRGGIRWALTAVVAVHWHPLTVLSHMFDATVFGAGPSGPHAINLLLHVVNTTLLFLVLRDFTGRVGASAVVAALFALHPLHVESVAWISARKDVLSMFFTLLALRTYGWYAQDATPIRMTLVAVLFACALMSKPIVVTFPFLLLLIDVWPLDRVRSVRWSSLMLEKAPLFGLSAISSLVTYAVQREAGMVTSSNVLPVSVRMTHAPITYVEYVAQTIRPLGLMFYYPYVRDVRLAPALACGAALGITTWVAWHQRRSKPFLLIGWLWYLGTLVPVIGLVQSAEQSRADRYTYLPLVGLFIAVVWLAREYETSSIVRRLSIGGVGLVLMASAVLTYRQAATWHDTYTLASHALRVNPHNRVAHNLLGTALMDRGDIDGAIVEFQQSLVIAETYEDQSNLGVALMRKGEHAAAVGHFQRSVILNDQSAEAHYNLGHAFMLLKQYDNALPQLTRATQLKNDYVAAHYELAVALTAHEDADGAIREFRTTARLSDQFPHVHDMLGALLAERGDVRAAVEEYREALRLMPDDVDVMNRLAWLEATHPLASVRNGAEAVRLAERALRLTEGRNPTVLIGLAAAYAEVGRFGDACATLERAIDLAVADGARDLEARAQYLLLLFKSNQAFRQPTNAISIERMNGSKAGNSRQ